MVTVRMAGMKLIKEFACHLQSSSFCQASLLAGQTRLITHLTHKDEPPPPKQPPNKQKTRHFKSLAFPFFMACSSSWIWNYHTISILLLQQRCPIENSVVSVYSCFFVCWLCLALLEYKLTPHSYNTPPTAILQGNTTNSLSKNFMTTNTTPSGDKHAIMTATQAFIKWVVGVSADI